MNVVWMRGQEGGGVVVPFSSPSPSTAPTLWSTSWSDHFLCSAYKGSFFNCSKVMKKMMFHGPSLSQLGQKPL